MDDGQILTEELAEHPIRGGLRGGLAFNGTMEFVAIFSPVARCGHPGQTVVKGGLDQAVLPVLEGGFKGIVELIIGQLVDTVAAGAEEFGGVANDNQDWRFSRTAAMTFFSTGEWLRARACSTTAKALSRVRESNQD